MHGIEPYLIPIFSGGGFLAAVLALRRLALPPGTMADAPIPLAVRRKRAVFFRLLFWGAAAPLSLRWYGNRPGAEVLFVALLAGILLQLAYDGSRPIQRPPSAS